LNAGGLTIANRVVLANDPPAYLPAAAPRRHCLPCRRKHLRFLLADVGGLSPIDVEQGWVFAAPAAACVIMLSSGIFASWLLVLQIGVPSGEKP